MSVKIALCGIFKNEAPYIVEWVAHHRLLGIDKIYIANNESTDGSEDIFKSLQEEGYIEYFNFSAPEGRAPQLLAYQEIINRYSSEVDWMGFVDADEFIFPANKNKNINSFRQILNDFHKNQKIGAVVLNWAVFGSSGHDFFEDKPIVERFNRRALIGDGVNNHYKSFFRVSAFSSIGTNPHFFRIKEDLNTIHINGEEVLPHKLGSGLSQEVIWDDFRLNHYLLKSKEEFIKKKKPNGSAATVGRTKGKDYFVNHDKNDEEDIVSEEYIIALKNSIREILHITSLNKSDYISVFDGKEKLNDLGNSSGILDFCEIVEERCIFKGWIDVDLSDIDSELLVGFSDFFDVPGIFHCVVRPDVFKRNLSRSVNCGFYFSLDINLLIEHGLPKYFTFRNKLNSRFLMFNDKFGLSEKLSNLVIKLDS